MHLPRWWPPGGQMKEEQALPTSAMAKETVFLFTEGLKAAQAFVGQLFDLPPQLWLQLEIKRDEVGADVVLDPQVPFDGFGHFPRAHRLPGSHHLHGGSWVGHDRPVEPGLEGWGPLFVFSGTAGPHFVDCGKSCFSKTCRRQLWLASKGGKIWIVIGIKKLQMLKDPFQ